MVGQGMHGFVGNKDIKVDDVELELSQPTDQRIFMIEQAFDQGITIDRIYDLTKIDKWFLKKLYDIYMLNKDLEKFNSINELSDDMLRKAKKMGFSDFQLARSIIKSVDLNMEEALLSVRNYRKSKGIVPFVKQIDTLAAEYPAKTNYLYLTYHGVEHDVKFDQNENSVVVLGSGAYRIGSSVEFDWCCVNAINTIRNNGMRSIMINYNPETVSTDYDVCDRLYFDELSFERVLDIYDLEDPKGVIISMGGQIPNNLAMRLHRQNVRILGTSPLNIDRAENRHKFSSMLDNLGIAQPRWKELTTIEDIDVFVEEVGFPVLIRPSYVLSGAAMNVVSNKEEMDRFLKMAAKVSKQYPVVVSEFIEQAKEIEIDAVAKNGELIAYCISEHVEYAGVHSGDATMVFPAQKLYFETIKRIKKVAKRTAEELHISGPFNIQFLAKDNNILVIECNLRASRSFPFVSKVLKTNLIELATKVMLDLPYEKPSKSIFDLDHIGIKAPQFSFSRLQKADPVLGVDMSSTGEVGCLGETYSEAILNAMLSVGYRIPKKAVLISSGPMKSKVELIEACNKLIEKGYIIYATPGTQDFLSKNDIPAVICHWPDEDKTPNSLELIQSRKVELVINIPKNLSKHELDNDYALRRNAVDYNIPLITNARLASAFILAFCNMDMDDIAIRSWSEYFN